MATGQKGGVDERSASHELLFGPTSTSHIMSKLSATQKRSFKRNGFLVLSETIDDEQCARACEVL